MRASGDSAWGSWCEWLTSTERADMSVLLEDIFDVRELNPDGAKKFDKVTRIVCKGQSYEMDMVVDINSDVYPVKRHDRFSCAIASTLSLDGKPDSGEYDPSNQPSLLDRYEYAMHGKLFRYELNNDKCTVFISFGGLLIWRQRRHGRLTRCSSGACSLGFM